MFLEFEIWKTAFSTESHVLFVTHKKTLHQGKIDYGNIYIFCVL